MVNWTETNNEIHKEFTFNNFNEALAFVNKVGALAEEVNHHPDILLHGYKNVRINLSTHSEGRVTEMDHELAGKIESLISDAD